MLRTCLSAIFLFAMTSVIAFGQPTQTQQISKTRFVIKERTGFSVEENEKLDAALDLLTAAVNSEVFKKRVKDFKYKGVKKFQENRNLDNEAVLKMFLSGAERTDPKPDNAIELRLEVSSDCPRRAIGTTYGKERTETYRCKLEDMTPAEYAGHLAHEYCHYLGFGHSVEHNPDRKATVPYAIGYILAAICGTEDMGFTPQELAGLNVLKAQLINVSR